MFAQDFAACPRSRFKSHWGLLLAACGSLSWVIATTAGCGQSSAKQAESAAAEESSGAPTTADAWLARMAAPYRTAKQYADTGTLHLEFVHGTQGQKIDETVDFSVTYQRPNRLRLHCYQAIVVADGKDLRATIGELEGQVLSIPCPQELAVESLFGDPSLAQALTQIAGSPPQVGLLFTDKFVESIQEGAQKPTLVDSRTIDDHTCQGVEIQRPDGRMVLWIDAQSYLLRRIEFPTDGLAKYLEQQLGEAITSAKLVADLRGATMDGAIDDTAFKFELPPNARQVSQFDRRQPPLPPSSLLGKSIPEFKFLGIDGTPINRESLAGKVVVFDFWATWCQPCLESLPNLQQVYERYKGNDKVVFCAVSIDQPDVNDGQIKQAFAERKLSIPIARDTEQQSQTLFQVASIPNLFILGADGVVEHNEIGFNPNLASELPEKLDKLLAGESIYEKTLKDFEARKAEFDSTFGQASPAAAEEQAETPMGRATIAARSEPASHKLTKLWSDSELNRPGNILPLAAGNESRLIVNDGWKSIIELDLAGKVVAKHELKVADLGVVSFVRTAVGNDGQRWFAGSANTQRQMYLFDQSWQTRLTYPSDANSEISDVQLADLDGDGQIEVCIAYWGQRGIDVIDTAGKLLWQHKDMENVFRLAVIGPADAPKTLYAAHSLGTLATFDAKGTRGAEITVPKRFVRNIVAADLNGDGTPELCGLAPLAQDRDMLIGLAPSGEELWRYELPSGLHEQPVEMIAAGCAVGTTGQWIVASADGAIQLLAADGNLVDRFHYGSAITGIAAAEVDGAPALIVASTEGLSAWRLEANSQP